MECYKRGTDNSKKLTSVGAWKKMCVYRYTWVIISTQAYIFNSLLFAMNEMCSNVLKVRMQVIYFATCCQSLPSLSFTKLHQKVLTLKVWYLKHLQLPFHKHPQIIIINKRDFYYIIFIIRFRWLFLLFLIMSRKSTFHIIFLIKIRYCYVVHRIKK